MTKKVIAVFIALLAVLNLAAAFADETDKTNYLTVTINGEPVDFEYVNSTKSMTGITHNFKAEEYTLSVVFNKDLKTGEWEGENSIKLAELISSSESTSGYYMVKKTFKEAVDSKVMLEVYTDEELKGEFSIMMHPVERYVGDMRPGIIKDLALEDGKFSFKVVYAD